MYSVIRNLVFLFAIGCGAHAAMDPAPVDVVRYWGSAGSPAPLERAQVVQVPASSLAPATWEIKGERAAFRVKREPAMLFLVRLPDGERPSDIHLYRLTGSGVRRPYPARDSWSAVTLSVTGAGDSLGLAPVGELNEGEYAFLRAGSDEAWCFGIDPPK